MMLRDTRFVVCLVSGLLGATPAGVAAQCRIDLVESGVQAYRDLDLVAAAERFNQAVAANPSGQCGTENARALVYLGATHWLAERPDSATRAFERAVIQAPRYQPDAVEFPPAVTDLFDRVRRETPAVAATLPEEVEIGPGSDRQALDVHLTASTDHSVSVTVRSGERSVRVLHEGLLEAGPRGTVVVWDGRAMDGRPVASGWYDLEIVSADARSRPVRKLVVALSVESDAPEPSAAEPRSVELVDTAGAAAAPLRAETSGGGNVWKAIGLASAGLVGGAAVVAFPYVVDGGSGSWIRYPIAGSLGVAGIIGFFQQLGGGEPEVVREPTPTPAAPPSPPSPPTLLIRSAYERRIEIDPATADPNDGRGGHEIDPEPADLGRGGHEIDPATDPNGGRGDDGRERR